LREAGCCRVGFIVEDGFTCGTTYEERISKPSCSSYPEYPIAY
jgi:hypothetical protein